MQESDGSIPSGVTVMRTRWSVGAVAARRRGKAEDWVQFPDGRFVDDMGGSSKGKMPGLQPGDRGSIPRPVH
jgi:hypothetical protein